MTTDRQTGDGNAADGGGSREDGWQAQLAAANLGDVLAIGAVLEPLRRYLLVVANSLLDPELKAKAGGSDLVQEAFLEAHLAFERFEGSSETDLLVWVRGILRNRATNLTRTFRHTAKRQIDREVELFEGDGSAVREMPLADRSPTPGQRAVSDEEADALNRAVGNLPSQYEQVIRLRSELGLSFDDVGRLMDRSSEAARKLWTRAVERLNEELDRRDDG